ncbi:2-hydroxyacid dehydrogenase [Novosphingobium resinovorum]|uniref:D-glycerate dehydrogenase n=1 Tax=Novosphingobium resinovorum TaxID=158500 RepID=A0A1D7ZZS1_9SPHN|nr:D-glycerate dehydrogenase [Novosphingobium resinovorum]AOR75365.1 D-glycerate dehydrogenase [Novosphingobium resinovorum]
MQATSQRPKILLTRRWPEAVETRLAASYDVTLNAADTPLTEAELAEAMRTHDALCPTVTDRVTRAVLTVPDRRVRIVGNYGAGFEHIDIAAAREAGVVVTNTPDVLTEATADIAMTLLLMASRRAGEGERELRAGHWTGWRPTHLVGQSLSGKLLGLVGFGRIARATAKRAEAFGMRIAYHSRRPAPDMPADAYFADLGELAERADMLSLHAPGGAETRHMVDAALLARMPAHAVLVNTGRGTLIDEAALAEALAERRIAAAGLDVYEAEPRVHPALVDLPNVVLLPHLGSATIEARTAMGMKVADNLGRFFAGEPLLDPVG